MVRGKWIIRLMLSRCSWRRWNDSRCWNGDVNTSRRFPDADAESSDFLEYKKKKNKITHKHNNHIAVVLFISELLNL